MTDNNYPTQTIEFEPIIGLGDSLLDLTDPIIVVCKDGKVISITGDQYRPNQGEKILAFAPALPIENLGDELFKKTYGVKYAYITGAMANGIASTEMIISLGKAGFLGTFGAAGITGDKLDSAIRTIQIALPNGPYAFNLLNSPNDETLEQVTVEKYIKYCIRVVEAAAYIDMTAPLIHYRASGLSVRSDGEIEIANRIIAKVSRKEVAEKFLKPAPENLLSNLVAKGRITNRQADLARRVPLADDITVEADSGGHTDNRPLVCLLPSILSLRNEIQAKYKFPRLVRIGAAGGISTPAAGLAAFLMGAAYIVTGTINQACVESGTSTYVKKLLAQASLTDVTMAPSADMFEIGAKVQVLKLGTLYPMRAQKLFDLYNRYDSVDQIPAIEQEKLNRQIFQRNIEDIWQEIVNYFNERNPAQIDRALNNPKQKMALLYRWYLGLSSRWAIVNEKGREMDYQIWCGPSIGSFNDWTRNTYLEKPENRNVVDVARQILTGVAYQFRVNSLKLQGINVPLNQLQYIPTAPIAGH